MALSLQMPCITGQFDSNRRAYIELGIVVWEFYLVSGTAPVSGRNVAVTSTGGNNVGATINTRVVTDGGATLTLQDAGPFS